MQTQYLYHQLNREDREVYATWLRKAAVMWAFILLALAAVYAVSALDGSTTPELRISPYQQSGLFP
jgi:hypothetical protein